IPKPLSPKAVLGNFTGRKIAVTPSQITKPKIIVEPRQAVVDRVFKPKPPNTSLRKPRMSKERQSGIAPDVVVGKNGRRHIRLY
ncbi:MAG: hypothetical protein ACHP6H_06625, partial [Legionellales bacterium]